MVYTFYLHEDDTLTSMSPCPVVTACDKSVRGDDKAILETGTGGERIQK